MSDADSRPHEVRQSIAAARRIVVKLGSRSLVGATLHEGADAHAGRFGAITRQIQGIRESEAEVVIVSSGAVALGRGRLGFPAKPRAIAELQACAAVGQTLLMRGWEQAFAAHDASVGQLLLSHADLADRERYLNARAALDALLALRVVPIVNENDTVAVDEIRFGDNDQLAAMVCTLAGADLLVLLSDVEGLLDAQGARIGFVRHVDDVRHLVAASPGDIGSGGMASKLDAAAIAARRGVPVVIADARDEHVLEKVLAGEDVGTLVGTTWSRLPSRKHWIAFTLRPRGELILDEGAVRALRTGRSSLLPAGILGVRGNFSSGDLVVLRDARGEEIGRGLCRYGTANAAKLAGARTGEIEARLGFHGGDEVVHRDDLVLAQTPNGGAA